jgi:mRNA-degrading endonuclease RelE of RelBE toxin-antitoxin system
LGGGWQANPEHGDRFVGDQLPLPADFPRLTAGAVVEVGDLMDAIRAQLPHQALEETRNRKPLRDHPLADWELRVQKYRVFYEVDPNQSVVRIVAVGHKEHNRLLIGGEEVEL